MKIIINPSLGGNDTGSTVKNITEKDYNLEISKMIFNNLIENEINAYLIRDSDITLTNNDRIRLINNLIQEGDNVIVLTISLANGNDSGTEIIYALKDTDNLANYLSQNIENIGINVLKYYQLRDPDNTINDYYEIINDLENTESIIVSLGYIDNDNDYNYLINKQELLAQAITDSLIEYINKENIYIVKSGDTLFMGNNE